MFFRGRRLIGEDALFPHALPQLRDEENAGGGDEGGGCEDNWDVEWTPTEAYWSKPGKTWVSV